MTAHKIGDIHQAAWWFAPGQKKRARRALEDAFDCDSRSHGLRFAPIAWHTLQPSDPECPPVPMRFRHRAGMRLLWATARIVGFHDAQPVNDDDPDGPILAERPKVNGAVPIRSFFYDLEPKDQERMIKATRQAYAEMNPGKPELSLERCVEYIEMIGPSVVERELRAAVDQGRV